MPGPDGDRCDGRAVLGASVVAGERGQGQAAGGGNRIRERGDRLTGHRIGEQGGERARDLAEGRLWQLPPYRGLPQVDVHLCHAPALRRNPAEAELLTRLQAALVATPLGDRTYGAT